MELTVEDDFMKITHLDKSSDLVITVIGISVLHAWKILQEKKDAYTDKKGMEHVTWVCREIEDTEDFPYLLHYRRDITSDTERVWIQTLTKLPENYLLLKPMP